MGNSVTKCAACGADLSLGGASCEKCGKPVAQTPQKIGQMARLLNRFAEKIKYIRPSAQDGAVETSPLAVPAEPIVAFAAGLPAWSIEPPAVVVRRKGKT